MLCDIYGKEWMPGRDAFFKILRKKKLMQRKPKPRQTTNSNHRFHKWENLIRGIRLMHANQLWVSDITYIDIDGGCCYLHLVTDAYSKKIVGWRLAPSLSATYTLSALRMAIEQAGTDNLSGLIHHSDRGVQYASYDYTGILKKHGIKISMTECGDPKDNAVAERVNGIIKNELLMGMSFFSIEEIRRALKLAIDFYNNERPHMSLDWKTPAEAALCTGELEKKWVSYREKAIKDLVA